MIRYVRAMVHYQGESRACHMLRSRLGWFAKGLPHAGAFREAIKSITAEDEALAVIDAFRAAVEKRSIPEHEIGATDGEDIAAAEDSGATRQQAIAGLQDR